MTALQSSTQQSTIKSGERLKIAAKNTEKMLSHFFTFVITAGALYVAHHFGLLGK